jgi:hypothetical protein
LIVAIVEDRKSEILAIGPPDGAIHNPPLRSMPSPCTQGHSVFV